MQPHICEKITNFPDYLTDRKQVERFLGCLNYISDFIPNLTWLGGPLQDLLKKHMNPQWQDYHASLVKQLKQLCTNLPRLAIPEPGDQLIVEMMPPTNVGEEFLKLEITMIKSMYVDMPMVVLNQLKLITIVMRKSC